MQRTLIIKSSIIAGLCLIFTVGLSMISSLIQERQTYSDQVVREIAEQHVKPQQIITPFFIIPTSITPACNNNLNDVTKKCKQPFTVLDAEFATQTTSKQKLDVSTNTYKRGIYHATSYDGDLTFNQNFELSSQLNQNSQPNTEINNKLENNQSELKRNRQWDKARLIIPVSDLRGITTLPTIVINNYKIKATYPQHPKLSKLNYIEVKLPPDISSKLSLISEEANSLSQDKIINLKVSSTFELSGISSLSVVPTGENFELEMKSNWHAPNFIGKALPNAKKFTNQGFIANWQNHYLTIANNQEIADCLAKSNHECHLFNEAPLTSNNKYNDLNYSRRITSHDSSTSTNLLSNFGVSFAEPNDVYLQTERTMKYALLLILVSFGTFFLFEIIKAKRIHPIQYLFVGSALLVFYILLLPLAEQITFLYAYTIAASACVGLIGWYSYYLLGSAKRAILFTSILGGLYAAFYGILTTEDLNLLLGAVFCFVLLASVMIMTRKIDWYKVA